MRDAPQTTNTPTRSEPIAVIGMACRFPMSPDLPAFWQLLKDGKNAVIEGVPGSNNGRIGKMFRSSNVPSACRFYALTDGIDEFDASFFRISPAEADLLDPQQRMLLEVSWHAFESAGINPERLHGSRTGVYGGVSSSDYRWLALPTSLNANPAACLHVLVGNSNNAAIGRIAYAFGLRGAAMTIDTACSSSLVAVHQAAVSLQGNEIDLALAGGVNAILHEESALLRAQAGLTSDDGSCKTFDAAANGYVRGEGCGLLVLKRLGDAEADGDPIWGVIRGSAVNQDGASEGLAAPNGKAQLEAIRAALRRAGVSPAQVDYVEAHGTGTVVGDPIELHALATAYGAGRAAAQPLLVGSVKTNVGHLEAAAGSAGLIKVLLAMQNGVIPQHRNFNTPTSAVDWSQLPLQVTQQQTTWPRRSSKPLASINSFGWSGTNAHIVLEGYNELPHSGVGNFQPPQGKPQVVALPDITTTQAPRHARILPLSAKTPAALQGLAQRYLSWLDKREVPPELLANMAYTACMGRSHFAQRDAIVFRDRDSLTAGLQQCISNNTIPALGKAEKIAFVYTGQGGQWLGMGKTLYDQEPVARAVLDKCDAIALSVRDTSLLDVMFGQQGAPSIDDTVWAQPAIYALECALTAMWSSIGVQPAVVMGHSLGEFAAMQAAEIYDVEAGMRFVLNRSSALAAVPEAGMMAAIFAPVQEVAAALRKHNADSSQPSVVIAAYNVVQQVISGTATEVEELSQHFEAKGVTVKRMKNQAFHCHLVEPAVSTIIAAHDALAAKQPSTLMISNVTGEVLAKVDAEYWRRHTVDAVEFRHGIEKLASLDVDLVIEIGPHAVLSTLLAMAWPDTTDKVPPILASLLRPSTERPPELCEDAFLAAVASAYTQGATLDFKGLYGGETRSRLSLPNYPFQRQSYWLNAARQQVGTGHPLLGVKRASASGEITYENEITPQAPSWLQDHRVFERVVMPGAAYGAMAIAAATSDTTSDETATVVVKDMQLHSAMIFPLPATDSGASLTVQLVIDKLEQDFKIYSRSNAEETWQLHASGTLTSANKLTEEPPVLDLATLKAHMQPQDLADFYRTKTATNINFGATFRCITALWSNEGKALGEISLQADDRLAVHPTLLDAGFQVLSAARPQSDATYIPFGWERLWIKGTLPARIFCYACVHAAQVEADKGVVETSRGDLWFYSPDGKALGGVRGFIVKRAQRDALLAGQQRLHDLLYEIEWVTKDAAVLGTDKQLTQPQATQTTTSHLGVWVLVADRRGIAAKLAQKLAQQQYQVVFVGDAEDEDDNITYVSIDTESRTAWSAFLKSLPTNIPLLGVVHLAALDGHGSQASTEEMSHDTKRIVASALALTQELLAAQLTPVHGTYFITCGAQVLGKERSGELAGAALWGLVKTMTNEASHLAPRMLDLDPRDTGLPSYLIEELLAPDAENHIVYRAGERKVARLVQLGASKPHLALPQDSAARLMPPLHNGKLRADRTYLITGGLGGIGLAVAEWLADHGAGAIVLNGRRAPDAKTADKLTTLQRLGTTVKVELADVTKTQELDAMLARIDASLPPLAGVIHSVGVLEDAALPNQSWEKFERVLWPKILGAWHLHRATKNLDMFVVFSSIAGVIGTRGQANHSAANVFLDQLIAHRRTLGLQGIAIAWGAWSGFGEAEEQRERIAEQLAARGSGWITPQQGIDALAYLLQQNLANTIVWSADKQGLANTYTNKPPLLENMLAATQEQESTTAAVEKISAAGLLTQLQNIPVDEYEAFLERFIQQELQASLRLSAPPSSTTHFIDLGIDSLMAVEVGNNLNHALAGKHTLPSTVIFEYPNVKDLARHLAAELADSCKQS